MIAERTYHATILIVDDHPSNLQVLFDALQASGYRTLIARNGEGAVKQAAYAHPDVILLDVTMPGIDGFETCRRLKAQEQTRDIPVIFMTALSDTVNKVHGFEAGGVDYITKPFDQMELLARVKVHAELRAYQKALQCSNDQLAQTNAELREAQCKLEIAATTDPLTRLTNRRDILEKLSYERVRFERGRRPFALVLSDIDDFKQFNDRYGHACGDFILVSVSDIMRAQVRAQDQLARWGGEEFLLMLVETDFQGACKVAEKIRAAVADHAFRYQDALLSASMTFGVSVFDRRAKSLDDCIKEADLSMYHGKAQGKNRVVRFDPAWLASVEHACVNTAKPPHEQ